MDITIQTLDALSNQTRGEIADLMSDDENETPNCRSFLKTHAEGSNSRLVFIAYDGRRVIGWAGLEWDVVIATIGVYVAPDLRRQGIGTRLVVRARAAASALHLQVFHGHRLSAGAHAFYQNLSVPPPQWREAKPPSTPIAQLADDHARGV